MLFQLYDRYTGISFAEFGKMIVFHVFLPAQVLVDPFSQSACPFAVNDGVEVWLDESLRRFDKVYPACGSSSSAIELDLEELERFSRARGWTDVCKPYDMA